METGTMLSACHATEKVMLYDKHYINTMKQVDILIPKNQALQMLYLKHHVYKTS